MRVVQDTLQSMGTIIGYDSASAEVSRLSTPSTPPKLARDPSRVAFSRMQGHYTLSSPKSLRVHKKNKSYAINSLSHGLEEGNNALLIVLAEFYIPIYSLNPPPRIPPSMLAPANICEGVLTAT